MLNHALRQTGWPGRPLTADNWQAVVWARVKELDWDRVTADVQPFLEPTADLGLLTRENLRHVLLAGQESY